MQYIQLRIHIRQYLQRRIEMKRSTIIALLLLLPLAVAAQSPAVNEFFAKYESDSRMRTVILGRKMMRMMSGQTSDRELSALLDEIEYIKVVTATVPDSAFIADARNTAATYPFQMISSVKEHDRETSFYIAETGSRSDLLMLSFGEGEWMVMGIHGRFDVRNISRLTEIRPK